jgi:tetratricopeptide (TPR) repeat protein
MHNRLHFFIIISLFLFFACKNDNDKSTRSPLQDSLLCNIDDSIKSQKPNSERLVLNGMRNASDSITYYEYYFRLCYVYYLRSENDSMNNITLRTLELMKKQEPKTSRVYELMGQAYSMHAIYFYHKKSHIDSVFYYYRLAYDSFLKSNNLKRLPNLCANIADAYSQKTDIPKAALWYRRALFLTDSLKMPRSSYVSLDMGLANIYMVLRDYKTAEQYYKQTEKYYKELDPNLQSYFLNNYGNFLYYKKDYSKALAQFRRMKKVLEKNHENDFDYYLCEINMADVFLNLNMADSARFYLEKAEPYFIMNNIKEAIYYGNTIKIGLALKENQLSVAKKIIERETVPPSQDANIRNIRNEYLRQYYERVGDYQKAYKTLCKYDKDNDSLEHNKIHMRATEIMMRFQQDTLSLHQQLNMQQKEKEIRKAYSLIIIIVAISIILALLLTTIIISVRKRELQNQINMLQLRLSNVRNRISPHFIFNVLNHEINKNKEIRAEDLINVTHFLRAGLDISRHTYVSLKEELDFVRYYIDTTKYILGNNFEFHIDALSNDILQSIKIPSMFVQILTENSIKHGLMEKEGLKTLSIIVTQNKIGTTISVKDNGIGFGIQKSNSSSTKTGLNIIRQSLFIINQRNSKKMTFSIHNILSENNEILGCEAILYIPSSIQFNEKI